MNFNFIAELLKFKSAKKANVTVLNPSSDKKELLDAVVPKVEDPFDWARGEATIEEPVEKSKPKKSKPGRRQRMVLPFGEKSKYGEWSQTKDCDIIRLCLPKKYRSLTTRLAYYIVRVLTQEKLPKMPVKNSNTSRKQSA